MGNKLSAIAKEVGVPVVMITAEEIRWAGKRGTISKQREEILLAELKEIDDFWKNPKYDATSVDYL